jgi:polyphenol oxidase
MELLEENGLKFWRFPRLAAFPGVIHGVFTRQGGVSTGPYRSLNLSLAVGDLPQNVADNRRRVQQALGLAALASATQVHGRQEAVIRGAWTRLREKSPKWTSSSPPRPAWVWSSSRRTARR